MKCPACWTEKAYVREVEGWKGVLLAWLLLRPMQCHHCYHKFTVHWISTLGKQIVRTPMKTASPVSEATSSTRHGGTARTVTLQSGAVVSGPHSPAVREMHTSRDAKCESVS